ncbi:MAG: ATP-binding cassette domain-containing protein [Betaproteobacteria bacterium]|nr:ATP-binding cassette domain-containing protein [Betaproteobacteria bacterium]
MLRLSGIRQRYGAKQVLALDRFAAAAGEHWLVLGASGSGKTTLLNLIAGLLAPSEGEIAVGGQILAMLEGAALDRWRGRNVGIVPQKLHLVSSLSVLDNLLLAPYLAGLSSDKARAASLLEKLNLKENSKAKPHQLSHGQAQRVAVARAVMNRPKLLLADEPTANLDDAHCEQALDLLQDQAGECGATLIVATHDQRAKARFDKRLELGA